MAIDPSAEYPGQIATDANYPYGKPRNVTVSGDATGTPLDELWLRDLFGFEQALLSAAGATPSGTPDHATASQYLDALKKLFPREFASYALSGATLAAGALVSLAEEHNVGGFVLGGNVVTVPSAGKYLIEICGRMASDDTSNPMTAAILPKKGSTGLGDIVATRFNATAGQYIAFAGHAIADIATPGSQGISIEIDSLSGNTSILSGAGNNSRMTIRKLPS